jgi:uncharacterized protein YjbJ (UPF0337 family)
MEQEDSMKSGNQDKAEGKFHQVKGKLKEVAGKISGKPELEIEGKTENTAGKLQDKVGDLKKVVDK